MKFRFALSLCCLLNITTGVLMPIPQNVLQAFAQEESCSALYQAAKTGNLKAVKSLIQSGSKVNQKSPDCYYKTAVNVASANGHLPVVKFLITRKADLDVPSYGLKYNALLAAVENKKLNTAAFLIEQGAGLESRDNINNTPLLLALENEDEAFIQLLLKHGADVNAQNDENIDALYKAVFAGKLDLVKFLVQNGANHKQSNLLTTAAIYHHVSIFKYLMQSGTPLPNDLLGDVTESGNRELIDDLLAQGQDLKKSSALLVAASNGNLELVKYLIAKGADLNAQFQFFTPLMGAIKIGRFDIFHFLVEKGADINIAHPEATLLMIAAQDKVDIKIMQYLLNHGADVNARNGGAIIAAASSDSIEKVQLLLDHGADVNAHGNEQDSPLIMAARGLNLSILKFLIEKGADPHFLAHKGRNAAFLTIYGYDTAWFGGPEKVIPILKVLSEKGINFNQQDEEGNTPLMIALRRRPGVVPFLLNEKHFGLFPKVDVNIKNNKGQTALDQTSKPRLRKMLEAHGAKNGLKKD